MSIFGHLARGLRSNPDSGWEIVCPDGRVRDMPYHNHGDAEAMAEAKTHEKCRQWPKPSSLELSQPPCPEGTHIVRPVQFSC